MRGSPRPAAARPAPRGCRRPGPGSSRPAASHASAHRIPRPPALVTTATDRPRRQRLGGKQRGDVEQLAERVGADDAGLAEQRVDRLLGPGQRRGVRARGPDPGPAAAALHGQDRLAARHAPREPPEAARVAERLEVDAAPPRSPGRPRSARAGRWRTRRPCCRSTRRPTARARARPPPARKARPSAPLCDEKPMLPAGMPAGPNVAFSRAAGGGDPEAVGPDQAAAVRADQREQARPGARRPRRRSRRTRRRSRTARARRVRSAASAASITRSAGHGDHRQVERVGHVGDRGDTRARPRPARRAGSPDTRRPRSRRPGCCGTARRRSSRVAPRRPPRRRRRARRTAPARR